MVEESNLRCSCGTPLRAFWLVNHRYYHCPTCDVRFNIKGTGCNFRFMKEIDPKTGKIGEWDFAKKKFIYKTELGDKTTK